MMFVSDLKKRGKCAVVLAALATPMLAQDGITMSPAEQAALRNNILREMQPRIDAEAKRQGEGVRELADGYLNVIVQIAPLPDAPRLPDRRGRSEETPLPDTGLGQAASQAATSLGKLWEEKAREQISARQQELLDEQFPEIIQTIERNRLLRAEEQRARDFQEKVKEYNETVYGPPRPNEFMSRHENEMHRAFGDYTTGQVSPVGSARTTRSPDPQLEAVLSAQPKSPFTTTVETPSNVATGAFEGTEGLNIAGVLNVFAYDSGNLQDGDIVRLTVRDSSGVVLSRTITLTFGGTTSRVSARRGLVNVTITAQNLGSSPPNTGGLRVSGDITGSRSGNFNLQVGQSGTVAVRVLGY